MTKRFFVILLVASALFATTSCEKPEDKPIEKPIEKPVEQPEQPVDQIVDKLNGTTWKWTDPEYTITLSFTATTWTMLFKDTEDGSTDFESGTYVYSKPIVLLTYDDGSNMAGTVSAHAITFEATVFTKQ